MLYERTALSKKPEETIRHELAVLREKGDVSPTLVFQDPYMLDFLQLSDSHSEKDLESAILREIERFVLELGSGFAFVERQKRITLDGDDYYIDLLFFHRRMRRLVAVELKIGDFKPGDSTPDPGIMRPSTTISIRKSICYRQPHSQLKCLSGDELTTVRISVPWHC